MNEPKLHKNNNKHLADSRDLPKSSIYDILHIRGKYQFSTLYIFSSPYNIQMTHLAFQIWKLILHFNF